MTEHWDGNNLPGIISWLVDLHGESSMRGVLGIYYQGLRTGALQLASVDTVVAQTVIDLVEAAVAAGEALPRPPEPVAPPQPAPDSMGGGGVKDEPPHRSGGPPAAPPEIQAALPDYTDDWGIEQYIDELPVRQLRDLRSLRLWLLDLEKPGQAAKAAQESIRLARRKVEHLLITRYDEQCVTSLAPHTPFRVQDALLCHLIKKTENTIDEKIQLAQKSLLRRTFVGVPRTAGETILEVLDKHSERIDRQLMADILRQGRDGCDRHHHV